MKKKLIMVGSLLIITLMVAGIVRTIYETHKANKKNEKYGITVLAEDVTSTSATFILECAGVKSEDTLCVDDTMGVIEKRTLFGWREVKHLRGGSFFVDTPKQCSIQYGVIQHRIDLEWEYYYGKLTKGTYRMKKGIYRARPIMSNEFVDYCYLTFQVK